MKKIWKSYKGYSLAIIVSLYIFCATIAFSIYLSYANKVEGLPQVKDVVLISVFSGLFATSLIELIKRLSSVRGRFHRNELRRWLGDRGQFALGSIIESSSPYVRRGDLESVMHSSTKSTRTSGHALSMYDLPLELLAAQLSQSLTHAISDPFKYRYLIYALLEQEDLDELLTAKKEFDRFEANQRNRGDSFEIAKWERTLSRINQQVQDQLDVFQLRAGHYWRKTISGWSVAASSASAAILAVTTFPSALLSVAVISPVVGAFVSWVARDLTAAIERMRRL
ncbi:hypothetical protein [Glutamicibacter soli]|uniref:hypothetical protein n=1 Tax=Glutamicibacter soli TaxID=453836 RepID=UPI0011BEFFF9|nr:hypothetical protein [Glutamicibacter soli]